MKNKLKFTSLILIVALIVSLIALPVETHAKTIKEFQFEVDKYTKELEAKKAKIATNDAEIAQIKERIKQIENKIAAAEEEIKALQKEIDDSNKEIEKKNEESKKIMEYYQISNGNNVYLEYAFGATTITDMIYRISVVEQLADYNDKIMKELKELIAKNEQKQKELAEKKKELRKMQDDLESEKERINADSKSIRETMPSLEEQIKSAKANVNYYKSLGCGQNEDIQACQYRIQQSSGGGSSIPSTNGFYRPIEYGSITQWYSGYGGHLGVDMISSNRSIAIYPIASGQVFKIQYDNCNSNNCRYGCNGRAKVVKIRHNVGGRYIYSTYAHLSNYGNIREGQIVTPFTVIGYMGNTGCSTGAHLHMEITTCDWNSGGGCTWATYQRSTVNPSRYVNLPSRWNNR